MATKLEFEDPDPVPSITVRVQVKARLTIEHVKMHVHVCWPLKSNVSSFEIPSVGKKWRFDLSISNNDYKYIGIQSDVYTLRLHWIFAQFDTLTIFI